MTIARDRQSPEKNGDCVRATDAVPEKPRQMGQASLAHAGAKSNRDQRPI